MYKKHNNQGVTLIEILIGMTIFVFLALGIYTLVIRGFRVVSFGTDQTDAIRAAEVGIHQMTREIREASTAEDGAYAMELAGDQEIIFYSDIDQDVYTERVRYTLSGDTLVRGVTEPTGDPLDYDPGNDEVVETLVEYVNQGSLPIFTYYNQDYPYDTTNNPLPAPARLIETKLINVRLRVNVTPGIAPNDFDVQSDIQIRNLKTNL